MKKTILVLMLVCFPFLLFGDDSRYCPLEPGQEWSYSFFSKKENVQKDDISSFINKTENYQDLPYTVYEVPSKSMRYFIENREDGLYMKAGRVDLPILSFINADVAFDPPVCVMKYPVKKGDKWRYEGKATVKAMLLVNIERKVWCDFSIAGEEKVYPNGNTFTAYRVHAYVCRSWKEDKPMNGDAWMAKEVGMVRGETDNSVMELKTYKRKGSREK